MLGRRCFLFVALGHALSLLCSGNVSADPRACVELMDESPRTGLPEKAPVIFRSPYFDHAQVSHKLKTFSDTAPSGLSRSEQCFRYEVENVGRHDVRNLYWELAGMRTDRLEPSFEGRRSKVRIRTILENPIDIDSQIDVFENTPVLTRAWAERRAAAAIDKTIYDRAARLLQIDPGNVDFSLVRFLKQNNLPVISLVAFDMSSGEAQAQRIEDRYSAPGFRLRTRLQTHKT